MKWDLVIRNVCDAVDPPRVPKKDIDVLTAEQVASLPGGGQRESI